MKKPNRSPSPSRWLAYSILSQWEEKKGFADHLLDENLTGSNLSLRDQRLVQTLVFGCLRHLYLLDFWIDCLAQRGKGSLPAPLLRILRLALYQSAFLDHIPQHAILAESLLLCDCLKLGGLKGLANALIRKFQAHRSDLEARLQDHPQRLSLRTSHPQWLVDWALNRFGPEKGERWLDFNNTIPRVFLKPLVSRIEPTAPPSPFSQRLVNAALHLLDQIPEASLAPDRSGLFLPAGCQISSLEAIQKGQAYIQDPGASHAVELLDPQPGEKILDLCAAPGGKTLQIADRVAGAADITAVDSQKVRLGLLEQNLKRCGFDNVGVVCRDLLADPFPESFQAHAVLLDAPCTGLGTLRRRVDLRYRLEPTDIPELADKGFQLLTNASRWVMPGGRLVYSTCTLTAEENEQAVRRFLLAHPDAWRLETEIFTPAHLFDKAESAAHELDDSDGSYCARLTRK